MPEVLKKHEIEAALHAEHEEISAGRLKEDNPYDASDLFWQFCQACRRGDLKTCQEKILEGVNINARDKFDYTPLILASLCGHFEVVQLLLESGALCERDTFQGERALYNALNDRIRNLLLSYDYSKSRDPLQPLAGHITSLLYRESPQTSDITISAEGREFHLHKFILAARSPYFAKKLATAPGTTSWKVPSAVPQRALETAMLALYLSEVSLDLGESQTDKEILSGVERLAKQLEIENLIDTLLEPDRRIARQRRTDEVERGQKQMEAFFERTVVQQQMPLERAKVDQVKWEKENSIFADVLLCAHEADEAEVTEAGRKTQQYGAGSTSTEHDQPNGIPVGPGTNGSAETMQPQRLATSVLFPAHRAMLLRSEYFAAMFSSPFREAQPSQHLPVVHVDCTPAVLQVILRYLYTEQATFNLDIAIDVLFAADQLFIEKLKVKAGMIISTLGNGDSSVVDTENSRGETDANEVLDVYDVVRAGWDTRVHRLEEFGARYMAYRLERYIDEAEFKSLVRESAGRIQARQETDTVELIDDIRYYLSERFRLRFEDSCFGELLDAGDGDGRDGKVPQLAHAAAAKSEPDGGGRGASHAGEVSVTQQDPSWTPSEADDAAAAREVGTAGVIRTLDGELAGDEFAQAALNYQILLGKIDKLLEELKLDA